MTNNWREIPDGQRVRVTFEADAYDASKFGITLALAGSKESRTELFASEADAATWELIDPPLRVGPAEFRRNSNRVTVLAVHRGRVWVQFPYDLRYEVDAALLRNISEGE